MKKGLLIVSLVVVSLSSMVDAAKAATTYAPKGYSIETVATPKDVLFHVTGLDAASDGAVFCATRLGEIWRLNETTWTKVADGLHEPTGLLIDEDGSLLVAQKPELTRLVDIDDDGIFDDYIRLADGWRFHDNYHEFNFGPVKDKQGNLYGTLNLGHQTPGAFKYRGGMDSAGGYRGWAYRVTPAGEFQPFAYGLRSPAGLGASPDGRIFYTDNQGDWVGTSKIHILERDKFYGHPASLIDLPGYSRERVLAMEASDFDKMRERPIIWIPHQDVANSPGNLEWNLTQGKFGPFDNQIFVGDQTQSNIFRVLLDEVKGHTQGAVINFIDGFQSGNIRLRFDPAGQLWVGQTARGWAAKGGQPYGLEKVVWDGTQPFELKSIKMTRSGFALRFTDALSSEPLQKTAVTVDSWYYHYHRKYGSPKVDERRHTLKKLARGNSEYELLIDLALEPGRVYKINFSGLVDKKGGRVSVADVYYTANYIYQ